MGEDSPFYEESKEAWNSYFYPDTDVLINKLNILDSNELNRVEREIVNKKLLELHNKSIDGSFDIKHLCDIHKYLFGDIYEWAGEFRIVFMSRDNKHPYFASSKNIRFLLEDDLRLMKEQFRMIYSYDTFINFLTDFYISLLNIHPFREGNGRTIREFLREFVVKKSELNGMEPCDLDWSLADHAIIEEAMPKGRTYKDPIKREIEKIVIPIEREDNFIL